MNIQQLTTQLQQAHQQLWTAAGRVPAAQQNQPFNGKWSALENVEHINKSITPLARFLTVPKETLGAKFGLSGGTSRTFDEVLAQYHAYLAKGGASTAAFLPSPEAGNLADAVALGTGSLNALTAALGNWTEDELDKYICPHPVLGNLTVREMLYFTIFHAQHHAGSVEKML